MSSVSERGKNPNENVEKAMREILDECNIMGNTYVAEAIYKVVSREHRTIQQTFISELAKFLSTYAEDASDLRNEASVEFAKKVRDMDHYFPLV